MRPEPQRLGAARSLQPQTCPCALRMHVQSIYATILACLKGRPELPAFDQNSATFYKRQYHSPRLRRSRRSKMKAPRCAAMFKDRARR